jgi:hypothetical protein
VKITLNIISVLTLVSLCHAAEWEHTELQEIFKYYDEFEGYTVFATDNSILNPDSYYGQWHMEIRQVKTKDASIYYWLTITYDGAEWFFIDEGKSLVLLIDGEKVTLTVDNSGIERDLDPSGKGAYIHERALYSITPSQIKKIAYANEVKFRIYGGNFKHSLDGKLSKENFQILQVFYIAVVENKWQEVLTERQKE